MRAKASKFREAAEYFQQAAVWKPDLAGLDRNWGFAAFRAELYSEAIPPLERQLTASPQDAFVRQLLGLSYFMTDNFAKTAEVFRLFLQDPPDDPDLLYFPRAKLLPPPPDFGMRLRRGPSMSWRTSSLAAPSCKRATLRAPSQASKRLESSLPTAMRLTTS